MSDLNAPVLVLNKGYSPIYIKPVSDAICDLFSEVCEVVQHDKETLSGAPNPYYYKKYTWAEWAELPLTSRMEKGADGKVIEQFYTNLGPMQGGDAIVRVNRVVHGQKGHVYAAPFVIQHYEYNDVPDLEIRLTRKNIWLRDGCKCQYCSEKVTLRDMTLDHVLPRAKGGKNSWSNLCTCCGRCNIRKGDRTPQQANMHLIGWPVNTPKGIVMEYVPPKPRWYPLFTRFTFQLPDEWNAFLPEAAKQRPPGVMVG
jgi:hypothetical protein